jgi:hypothetical protein
MFRNQQISTLMNAFLLRQHVMNDRKILPTGESGFSRKMDISSPIRIRGNLGLLTDSMLVP